MKDAPDRSHVVESRQANISEEPDWERIRFDVPCTECGENLRGRTEPLCPSCGLRFDWERVLPIDSLRCKKCQYQLFGLPEQRCPECGTPFEWPDVLLAARVARIRLFEFLWFANPLPGLARSIRLAAFRPRKLWAEYCTRVPPRLIPLLLFMLTQWAIFAWGWHVTAWTIDPTINALADWLEAETPLIDPPAREFIPRSRLQLRFIYPFRVGPLFLPAMGVWYLATFGALQLLFQTKRRLRIRWPEIFRVYVHATVFAALCTGLWCVLEGLLDSTLFFTGALVGRSRVGYAVLTQAVFIIGLVVTWTHLWIGLTRHLRIPCGWLVAGACLLIGYLTTITLVP